MNSIELLENVVPSDLLLQSSTLTTTADSLREILEAVSESPVLMTAIAALIAFVLVKIFGENKAEDVIDRKLNVFREFLKDIARTIPYIAGSVVFVSLLNYYEAIDLEQLDETIAGTFGPNYKRELFLNIVPWLIGTGLILNLTPIINRGYRSLNGLQSSGLVIILGLLGSQFVEINGSVDVGIKDHTGKTIYEVGGDDDEVFDGVDFGVDTVKISN